jgi:hypothetical protein
MYEKAQYAKFALPTDLKAVVACLRGRSASIESAVLGAMERADDASEFVVLALMGLGALKAEVEAVEQRLLGRRLEPEGLFQ